MKRSWLIGVLSLTAFLTFGAASAQAEYFLRVSESRASEGSAAFVAVTVDPNGTSLAAIAFFVEFDRTRLKFDPVSKGGGLDNIEFVLPEGFNGTGMFLSESGRIGISLYDPSAPLATMHTPAVVARLRFDVLPGASGFAWVRIAPAPPPNASDLDGNIVPAGPLDHSSGGVVITNARGLLRVSPSALSFGTVAEGTRVERNLVLSNEGDAPIRIDGVRLAPGSPAFTLVESPPDGTIIEAGGARVVRVAFIASSGTATSGEIRITTGSPATTMVVPLSAHVSSDSWLFDSRWLVPAIASLPGANGARWQSRLALHNGGDAPLRARLTLYATDGTISDPATVDLAPRATRVVAEVVGEIFSRESGTGFVLVESSSPELEVRSETANVSGGVPAGQSVPVIRWSDLFRKGEVAHLIALDRTAGNRTNIALLNLTDSAVALHATVRDREGAVIGERPYILEAMSIRQSIDLFDALQIADATGLTVSIGCETDDCRFFAYASTVDGQGRPVFQSPR